ncbi:MAG: hypothetical protein KAU62_07915 [Candidatus Heimdallarchaeota archaeon]|nr:hypothetical protein [Candidatus Heimdallarchaeota archaeon]MCK4611066.1 hypothetical protein [Candidatus Heimdallarchaeota archaeon]
MNLKTKRKTKTILFSTMLICLFILSFSLGTKAAVDLIYDGVSYANQIEVQNLPIEVSVLFIWGTGASVQSLDYVHLDYDTQKDIVEGLYRVSYDPLDDILNYDPRPEIVSLTIPEGNLDENDTVYFKIIYQWYKFGESNIIEKPSKVHKVDILYQGEEADIKEDQTTLYIILGSCGAVVLIALSVMYTIRRRK